MKTKGGWQNMGPLNTRDLSCSEPALVLSPVGRTPADFCVSNKTKTQTVCLRLLLCALRSLSYRLDGHQCLRLCHNAPLTDFHRGRLPVC